MASGSFRSPLDSDLMRHHGAFLITSQNLHASLRKLDPFEKTVNAVFLLMRHSRMTQTLSNSVGYKDSYWLTFIIHEIKIDLVVEVFWQAHLDPWC